MEKLKDVIEQYGRWRPLEQYILRIETYLHSDFGLALENSKAILESISREICNVKNIELSSVESMNGSLKKACKAIGYDGGDLVTQLSTSIANIGQQMGNLRNSIGPTSHGRTMEELVIRNNGIDELTKEFLINTTELVSCFLIKNFEIENTRVVKSEEQINYTDNEDFNEFWDEMYGEFNMGDYAYIASEIFYNLDYMAYEFESKSYSESMIVKED